MQNEELNEQKSYLIFKLKDELFGTPLLDIREVAEYQNPRPIPNSVSYLSGAINIRGEILSVIDLRKKYRYPDRIERTTALLVFAIQNANVACIVDSLAAVYEFEDEEIQKSDNLSRNFDADCFIGFGKIKEDMVTLIDLKKILENDNVIVPFQHAI